VFYGDYVYTFFQNNLTEMKSFSKPPTAVIAVTGAVMILLANKTKKIPKDRSWNAAKVMMSKVFILSFLPIYFLHFHTFSRVLQRIHRDCGAVCMLSLSIGDRGIVC